MNKKLFALLASAAVVAGTCPAVFADAASTPNGGVKLVPDKTEVAAGDTVSYDVYVTGDTKITAVQFTLDATGGEVVSDVQQNEDGEWNDNGFVWDNDGTDELEWGKKNRGYIGAALEKKSAAELEMFGDSAKPYLVMGFDIDAKGKNPGADGIKIGTVQVKAGESGTVSLTAGNGIANYIDADKNTVNANWTVDTKDVTIGGATSSEEESKVEESSAAESKVEESSKPAESKAAESSKPAASNTESKAESSKAATNNNGTTKSTSSTAKTNNTNDNKNTGAASTAAVALVGAAAALVVVSKKRK